ncbi:MAG: hypothetical protein M1382_02225 [Candidatus Marsarchaeota archaeon]|nr:hypothetical protein [Candidatus Marsarchaeota archaeon]
MRKAKTEKFNRIEKEILGVLASAGKPITTYYIAEKAGTTRITAKKYLLKLLKEGVVQATDYTGKQFKQAIYWWFNYE